MILNYTKQITGASGAFNANCEGVEFWLMGAYALFILKYIFDTFQNIKDINKKNRTQSSYVHAHKVVSR
jgi:hypothetical protein